MTSPSDEVLMNRISDIELRSGERKPQHERGLTALQANNRFFIEVRIGIGGSKPGIGRNLMTVLVTGGAGYIGSYMVYALVPARARLVPFDTLFRSELQVNVV